MNENIENLKEALRQLEPYNDPTTNAIKALAALVLESAPPAKAPQPPAAPESPKP